jgi:hypothetical protein
MAYLFKVNDVNHVVVTLASHIKRDGRHRALCAIKIDSTTQRLHARAEPGRSALITCDGCSRSFDGLVDALDRDFDYDVHDDGTGRF